MGKISNWSDPAIAKANPDIKFPNQSITVVHRSDGSGTSYIFTDYLSKISSDWQGTTGKGTSVKWPVGVGGKGNEGVAGMIRQLPGSVGYIELIYALQNKINYGSVKNSSGQFIKASLDSTTAAAAGVKMPADFRVSITNPPGKTAYPIASFTWLLIPTNPTDQDQGQDGEGHGPVGAGQRRRNGCRLVVCSAPEGSDRKEKAAVNQQVK